MPSLHLITVLMLLFACFYTFLDVNCAQATDHPSFTKAVGRVFFSIAISKQLNAAPYLGGVHGISLAQGELEAIKMLSGFRAPCCDKHQFHVKMMVSTYLNCFQDITVVLTRKKEEDGTFAATYFCVLLSSTRLLGNYESC